MPRKSVSEFSASRLELARKFRLMTQKKLAQESGVTSAMLSKYESGLLAPSMESLIDIAESLAFAPEFFLKGQIEAPDDHTAAFRKRSKTSVRVRDAALAAGKLAMEFCDWIEDELRVRLPAVDIPDLSGLPPEDAAIALRGEWGLGDLPISNMVHLLESRGIRVFSLWNHSKDVDAFSQWENDSAFIFLNLSKATTGERGRFDAAHELGHLVRDRVHCSDSRKMEREADHFASAFLMPEGSVMSRIPFAPSVAEIHKHKRFWRVSAMALVYRCRQIGKISDWVYRSLCKDISMEGGRKAEKNGILIEQSQVWRKVFSLLNKDGISIHDISKELAIPASDIKASVFGLAMLP